MRSKLLCTFLCLAFGWAQGQEIEWDKSFGDAGFMVKAPAEKGNGESEAGESAIKLDNGKMLTAIYRNYIYLQRYLPDGTLDQSYARQGRSERYFIFGAKFFRLPDGKILLAGYGFSATQALFVYRLLPDGNPDVAFNNNMPLIIPLEGTGPKQVKFAIRKNGEIVLFAGAQPWYNAADKSTLACLNADGSLDTTFGTNGKYTLPLSSSAFPFGMALSGSRIFVGYILDGKAFLARYNEHGMPDTQFGNPESGVLDLNLAPFGNVATLSSSPNGHIMVGASVFNPYPYQFSYNISRLQADGAIDSSFGSGGIVSVPQTGNHYTESSLLTDANGDMLIIGSRGYYNPNGVECIRLNADGALDKTFGTQGRTSVIFAYPFLELRDAILAKDGALILAGRTGNYPEDKLFITALNRNGQPETGFGINGTVEDFIPVSTAAFRQIRPLTDGSLYASYDGKGVTKELGILRIKVNGVMDSTFGNNGLLATSDPYYDTLSGGRLITAKQFYDAGRYTYYLQLAQFLPNGKPDSSFGTNGVKNTYLLPNYSLWQIKTLPGNRILVYGASLDANNKDQFSLACLKEDGTVDTSFGASGYVYLKDQQKISVLDIVVLKEGKILLGGSVYGPNNYSVFAICRLLPNGTFDESFGDKGFLFESRNLSSYVNRLVPQPDGHFIVEYGQAVIPGNNNYFHSRISRFNEKGQMQLDFGNNGVLPFDGYYQALDDGRLLVMQTTYYNNSQAFSIKMRFPGGEIDSSFGMNGIVNLQFPSFEPYLSPAAKQGNKIFVHGSQYSEFETKAVIGALVIKQHNSLVSSFTLLNSTSDKDIRTLEDSTVINLAEITGKGINIRANTEGEIGSLRMQLSGTLARTQTENIAPYALFGNTGSNYKHWRPQTGSYTLEAVPFAQAKATGAAGAAHAISFRIIDSLTLSELTLINAKTNKPIGPLQDGGVIDLAQTPYINIKASPGVGITESVRFSVNDSSYRVESIIPFALAADYKGRHYPWQVTPGTYTVTATPYSQNWALGKPGHPLTITIQIINSNATPAAIAQSQMEVPKASLSTGVSLSAYPNPATTETYVQYQVLKTTTVSITLVDQKGTTVRQVYRGSAAAGVAHKVALPLTRLTAGIYFIKLTTAEGTTATHKIVKQ